MYYSQRIIVLIKAPPLEHWKIGLKNRDIFRPPGLDRATATVQNIQESCVFSPAVSLTRYAGHLIIIKIGTAGATSIGKRHDTRNEISPCTPCVTLQNGIQRWAVRRVTLFFVQGKSG